MLSKSNKNRVSTGLISPIGCVLVFRLGVLLATIVWADWASSSAVAQGDDLPKFALFKLNAHTEQGDWNGVYELKFSPDGRYLAARTRDQIVHVYDLNSRQIVAQLDGHEGFVKVVEFTADSSKLITAAGGAEEQIKIWNPATGHELLSIDGGALHVRLTDKNLLIAISENLWREIDLKTGEIQKSEDITQRGDTIIGADTSGKKLALFRSSSRTETYLPIRIYDTENPKEEKVELAGVTSRPRKTVFSGNDGFAAAIYSRESEAFCWNLNDAKRKFKISGHGDQIEAMRFSNDSRWLASVSWDETIKLWDLNTGDNLQTLYGHNSHVCSVEFSLDGRLLATGSSGANDCSIIVWDLGKGLYESKLAEARHVSGLESEKLWELLTDKDSALALGAASVIIENVDDNFEYVKAQIAAMLNVSDEDEIRQLIEQLDSPEYSEREEAFQSLKQLRTVAENVLRDVLNTTSSIEVRIKVSQILAMPLRRPSLSDKEYRRMQLVIFTMERVNSQASRDMLKKIALGFQHIDISRAARESLDRIQ